MYINTMLGTIPLPRRAITDLEQSFGPKFLDGLEDSSEYECVSDCELCDVNSIDGGNEENNKTGEGADGEVSKDVGEIRKGVEKRRVSRTMREVKEDNEYDAVELLVDWSFLFGDLSSDCLNIESVF
ncbi:uncharacterized protein DFL_003063 [Arthrobotrys flagrans]|uniref:Uncharacterized protein n=1 Tax=Arthrobotrys flagrans TaxID=97331 RepID=A0A437ACA9_ARTFL|nr:hypothetical protein DFL_003063 [Arthrobotrys flagrans]